MIESRRDLTYSPRDAQPLNTITIILITHGKM